MPSNIKLMMMWGNVREYATQASNFQKLSATQSIYLLIQLAAYQANSASMMKPISLSVASGAQVGLRIMSRPSANTISVVWTLPSAVIPPFILTCEKITGCPQGYWGETTLIPKFQKQMALKLMQWYVAWFFLLDTKPSLWNICSLHLCACMNQTNKRNTK